MGLVRRSLRVWRDRRLRRLRRRRPSRFLNRRLRGIDGSSSACPWYSVSFYPQDPSIAVQFSTQSNVLELVDAVHSLGLLLGVHKTAKRRLELFTTRPVSHTAQTRTIPIDLSGFRVESALLIRFLL